MATDCVPSAAVRNGVGPLRAEELTLRGLPGLGPVVERDRYPEMPCREDPA